jgi:hypothetical protein
MPDWPPNLTVIVLLPLIQVHSLTVLGGGGGVLLPPPELPPQPMRRRAIERARIVGRLNNAADTLLTAG